VTASHVLIVDDDPAVLEALPEALQLRLGDVTVDTADTAAAALDRIAARDYDAIVTDIKMPGLDGFALLAEIRTRRPDTPTLLITGHGEPALAIEALRGGAYDFVQKPIDREYFVATLCRAIQMNERNREVKQQQQQLERRANELERAVEQRTNELREASRVIESPLRWLMVPSRQMELVVQQIKQVADSSATVLVEGETGTGKELVARAIHQLSARRTQPFVPIDCGAIADAVIESEMFPQEPGPCSGDEGRTEGRCHLAEGGTLFLDEVASLPLPMQSKLLRALQERHGPSPGGTKPAGGDARIIAASSVPLEPEVQAGRFRPDVSDALHECVISLPALRERDDILQLANALVAEASVEFGRPCREISEAAARVLLRHSWPGNVRELRNVIRRATLLASGVIEREHLSLLDGSRAPTRQSDPTAVGPSLKDIAEAAAADAERQAIRQALQASHGNKTEAARRLRTDYKTLHLKIKQHGIDTGRFRKFRTT
jgi:two-component system, NtrC family, C4-dicarboxylate transport response regulator DctD